MRPGSASSWSRRPLLDHANCLSDPRFDGFSACDFRRLGGELVDVSPLLRPLLSPLCKLCSDEILQSGVCDHPRRNLVFEQDLEQICALRS